MERISGYFKYIVFLLLIGLMTSSFANKSEPTVVAVIRLIVDDAGDLYIEGLHDPSVFNDPCEVYQIIVDTYNRDCGTTKTKKI